MMKNSHHTNPRVVNTDKSAAYPGAVEELKQEQILPDNCNLRQCKYLNNIVEQDHRFIKKRVNIMLGFGSFRTALKTLRGIETMHMIRKGQVEGVAKGDLAAQVKFFTQIFDQAA